MSASLSRTVKGHANNAADLMTELVRSVFKAIPDDIWEDQCHNKLLREILTQILELNPRRPMSRLKIKLRKLERLMDSRRSINYYEVFPTVFIRKAIDQSGFHEHLSSLCHKLLLGDLGWMLFFTTPEKAKSLGCNFRPLEENFRWEIPAPGSTSAQRTGFWNVYTKHNLSLAAANQRKSKSQIELQMSGERTSARVGLCFDSKAVLINTGLQRFGLSVSIDELLPQNSSSDPAPSRNNRKEETRTDSDSQRPTKFRKLSRRLQNNRQPYYTEQSHSYVYTRIMNF